MARAATGGRRGVAGEGGKRRGEGGAPGLAAGVCAGLLSPGGLPSACPSGGSRGTEVLAPESRGTGWCVGFFACEGLHWQSRCSGGRRLPRAIRGITYLALWP